MNRADDRAFRHVSVHSSPDVRYPDPIDWFSPGELYPEYTHEHVARAPNHVYSMVRQLLATAGLDSGRFGSPHWNPLSALIPRGASVFILCNFVYHRRAGETEHAFQAKCIHGSVLRPLIDYVLLAVGSEGRIRFGNAPLQSCDWNRVQEETGATRVQSFYESRGLPVVARDLRLLVRSRDLSGAMTTVAKRDDDDGIEIDLGTGSLLEDVVATHDDHNRFRVSDYDPRRTQCFHSAGHHRYVVHRDILEADVVISLSKLKTHEKVGITCGLKGFVGAVGHKDSLAHHRFGSPSIGGDEYPTRYRFLEPLSSLHDWVYSRAQGAPTQAAFESLDRILRTAARRCGAVTSGAWWGNDTAWRMALDLARILYFADDRGEPRDGIQRRHLALIDGIVAGEGNGPLDPTPVNARTLVFGSDVAAADRVACRLMGWSPEAIPLVRQAFADPRVRISSFSADQLIPCIADGESCVDADLKPALGRAFTPPDGWEGRVNRG